MRQLSRTLIQRVFASAIALLTVLPTLASAQVYYSQQGYQGSYNYPSGQIVQPIQGSTYPGQTYPSYQTQNYPTYQGQNYPTYQNQSYPTYQGQNYPSVQTQTYPTTPSYPSNPSYSNPTTQTYRPAPAANTPGYQQTFGSTGGSKQFQGNTYNANAGIGLDQRTDSFVGTTYDKDGKFVGVGGTAGAGLYGDAGVSQSGQIGSVPIRNYAEGQTFVGTEVNGKAGFGNGRAVAEAGAFSGGRVSGTIGTDIGPVGYGATGEAWSGAGIEGGLNAGFDDGVLSFGGELGAGLGVGGKLGVQGQVDVGAIGDGIKTGAQHVGQWGRNTGGHVKDWTQDRAQDIGRGISNTGNKVKNGLGTAGNKVKNGLGTAGNKVKNGIGTAGDKIKGGFGKIKGIFK